ncbi:MAG: hypothetical protein ACK2T0_07710 [Anaerolineales bacterium]
MSRYSTAARQPPKPPRQPAAIWRGIGCVLMIVVPVVAWILASATIDNGLELGWPMPYQLTGYAVMPQALWGIQGAAPILTFLEQQPHLYASLLLCVVYIILVGALISVIYSILYRFIGPPRYGPLDAPPPRVSLRKYKR